MYIVVRRGAFETIDEGGRLAGLAAVARAARVRGRPGRVARRGPGKVVLRARSPSAVGAGARGAARGGVRRRRRAPAAPALRARRRADEDPGDVDRARAAAARADAPLVYALNPDDRDELRQDAGPDRARRGDGGGPGLRRVAGARDRPAATSTGPAASPRCATPA